MEHNTNEKCYISELMSLVYQRYTDYEFKSINPNAKAENAIIPIWYMLPPIKEALDELYDLASSLCECVGHVELDDKHDWEDDDISAEQSLAKLVHIQPIERQVLYNVDISDEDPMVLKKLETIYGEDTRDDYRDVREYIIERLNNDYCLSWLNAGDDEYAWKVCDVWHRGDEKRIILVIEAYRKDKDNDND